MTAMIRYDEKMKEIQYLQTLAGIAHRSKSHPHLSEDAILNLMLTATSMGVDPMRALNGNIHVIKGKPSVSVLQMAESIRKAGHSIKIIENTATQCVLIGVRRDNGDSFKATFTLEDAKRAGLLNSPTWKSFPQDMLYSRALSSLARKLFPDVLGTAYSDDEKHDIVGTPPERRPLEDPDCLTIEATPALPELTTISEEMVCEIAHLIAEREVNIERMYQAYKLDKIEDIQVKDFPLILKALKMKPLKQNRTTEIIGVA